MSAGTEVLTHAKRMTAAPAGAPLRTRLAARLHRRRLDAELAAGADPNDDPVRRERAHELVGPKARAAHAACLEELIADADAPRHLYSSKVPVAREAIRAARADLEAVVAKLRGPAYVSPQGVARLSLLLTEGASPVYNVDPEQTHALRSVCDAVEDALDNGPALVG